ncbi:NGDN [Cordylochernes scorpioides]|uniref:NGDN n=1 Tax=Cordylochernes scorpioides TaxID=51811 RepID=A0ABY6KM46_9ARAC|nr:NGDN [Cordylochernes scorpioides]
MALNGEDLATTKKLLKSIISSSKARQAKLNRLSYTISRLPELSNTDDDVCNQVLGVKNDLIVNYLASLTSLMCVKVDRKPIGNNPAVEQIVENRVVFEQLKKHDRLLKSFVETNMKNIKTQETTNETKKLNIGGFVLTGNKKSKKKKKSTKMDEDLEDEDEDRFVPFTSDIKKKMDDDSDEYTMDKEEDTDEDSNAEDSEDKDDSKKEGLFQPIKINPTTYQGDLKIPKEERKKQQLQKRSLQSSILMELQQEHSEGPLEIRENKDLLRHTSDKMAHERQRYEEDTFTRLQVSKKDKTQARKLATVNSAHTVTNFHGFMPYDDENLDDFAPPSKKRKFSKQKKGKKNFKRRKH